MNHGKKFLKYLLPVIVLPLFAGQLSSMLSLFQLGVANLGVQAVAARSAISHINTMDSNTLILIAIAALSISMLFAEKGRIKIAKIIHLACLGFHVFQFVVLAAIYAVYPGYFRSIVFSTADQLAAATPYMRIFALTVILAAAAAALPCQLSGRHSFILTTAVCIGICIFCWFGSAVVYIFRPSLSVIAVFDGLNFATTSVIPFLMVPVKSYSKAFAPSIPE